ncbi:hypothetical protein SAMN02910314_01789 [Denitrobacterium detoxificans]|uniref:Uncharacterized protein n=1 Tax=Denitrobacterium detoxificans TaxID=79604 RepID=A0A1H8U447_9ACTN|nr:hypothetical protein SAMN02910314_01648 [Denitrobacterium detoxificans]SEO97624.1 hypothetical protein SAMN02910314_01789 [Denitrobacterium detoxificans]
MDEEEKTEDQRGEQPTEEELTQFEAQEPHENWSDYESTH